MWWLRFTGALVQFSSITEKSITYKNEFAETKLKKRTRSVEYLYKNFIIIKKFVRNKIYRTTLLQLVVLFLFKLFYFYRKNTIQITCFNDLRDFHIRYYLHRNISYINIEIRTRYDVNIINLAYTSTLRSTGR